MYKTAFSGALTDFYNKNVSKCEESILSFWIGFDAIMINDTSHFI